MLTPWCESKGCSFRRGCRVMGLNWERTFDLMSHDKKVLDGKLRLVLLRGLGPGSCFGQRNDAQIVAAIEARCTKMASFERQNARDWCVAAS